MSPDLLLGETAVACVGGRRSGTLALARMRGCALFLFSLGRLYSRFVSFTGAMLPNNLKLLSKHAHYTTTVLLIALLEGSHSLMPS